MINNLDCETKINAPGNNVFARQTEQVLVLGRSLSLSLVCRVQCGVAHKLWILRDICQMQHISFIPSFLALNPTPSSLLPYREIDPRLVLLSLLRLSPEGSLFFHSLLLLHGWKKHFGRSWCTRSLRCCSSSWCLGKHIVNFSTVADHSGGEHRTELSCRMVHNTSSTSITIDFH